MRIFVLGAGATGGRLAGLLARQGHTVWCGDRDPERARRFLDPAIPCQQVNARNQWSVVRAARSCHLLVNASPTVFNQTALRAALRLRAHYLDLATHHGRSPFKPEQLRFDARFRQKRRVALINAGLAPGVTNLLVAASADLLDAVEQVHIRLFEHIESREPVSTWSAESAFHEALSPPPVYRARRFALARRFGEPEWFRFPHPIGRVRVVLAAQDEVATLPHGIPMQEIDVKVGGNEIERERRWYRQGKLRRSRGLVRKRYPPTLTPRQVARLIRRGLLQNARFAASVLVRGMKKGEPVEHRWDCLVPTLYQIRMKGLHATPVAYATANAAALFVKYFPRDDPGVHPPEALAAEARRAILTELKKRGFPLTLKTRRWKKPELDEEEI